MTVTPHPLLSFSLLWRIACARFAVNGIRRAVMLLLFSLLSSLRCQLLLPLDQRLIRGWVSLYPPSVGSKPATKACNVVAERGDLRAFTFSQFGLAPFTLISLPFLTLALLVRQTVLLLPLPLPLAAY